MKLTESEKINPQDYFLQSGVDANGDPVYSDANQEVADYAPAKAFRKKVFDGEADIVVLADTVQIYWKGSLVAEAQLDGQVETSPGVWQGQLFSFADANVQKITEIEGEDPEGNPIMVPVTPFFRAYEVKDIPALGITDAVFGMDVHWAFKDTKLSFYLDAPGFNSRIRWQCRVKDSAVAWTDNSDPENPIYHKGLFFSVSDYEGEVNHGSMPDPEPGWTIHWWTFEPDGKQIDPTDSRTPLERYEQGVGLVVDPYLSVDEQSTYVDIFCDGYKVRVTETNSFAYVWQVSDLSGTNAYAADTFVVKSGGTNYALGWFTTPVATIIENTPNRVKIRIDGNLADSSHSNLTNSDYAWQVITIYPDRISDHKFWKVSASVSIDDDSLNLTNYFSITEANLTNEEYYYEDGGSETQETGQAEHSSAKYFLLVSDEINIQQINLYNNIVGTATYQQYLSDTNFRLNMGYDNGSCTDYLELINEFIFDSAAREGSAQIYNSTKRLAMGDQYKDPILDQSPSKGDDVTDMVFPARISSGTLHSDGAHHYEPVSPRDKPATDNDDLKTAPDVDASGGIAENLSHWWMMNEGSGTAVDDKGSGANDGTISGADWIDGADPDTGLDFISNNSDKVDLASNITIGTNDYTVIAKVKIDATLNDTDPGILGSANSGSGYGIPLQIDSGTGQLAIELDGTEYLSGGTDITDGEIHTVAVSVDRSGNATFYIDGVSDGTADVSGKSAVSLTVTSPDIGNNPHTAGRFLDGEIHYLGMWIGEALTANQVMFITNNPYWMFGDAGHAKLTLDRTRIRPNIVIHDWPFQYGSVDNPTDILLNHLKMDDNAANNDLLAEVGPDAGWYDTTPTDRNTDNDSVAADNFRGRALDSKGSYHAELVAGAGTVHNVDAFVKGAILIKATPQFTYTIATWQQLFRFYQDGNNSIGVHYDPNDDRFELYGDLNNLNIANINGPTITSDYELQRQMIFLASWDWDKDMCFFAIDGQMQGFTVDTDSPSASEPSDYNIGATQGPAEEMDMIIDEIQTFSECLLSFGAFHIGNGSGLLADIDNPHADLTWFFDGQAAAAKGGTDLASDKNPTNSGGSFVTTDPLIGTNHWDANGATNVLTVAEVGQDIVDYNNGFVAGWFNVQSFSGGEYLIDVRDADGSDRISAVLDASGNIDVTYRSNSTDEPITGDIAITAGKWFFLKITWDDNGGDKKVHSYINGQENGTPQTIANTWGGGTGLTWYFTEDYNGANGADAFIQTLWMGKKANIPEIWTAFGKPLHLPLVDLQ